MWIKISLVVLIVVTFSPGEAEAQQPDSGYRLNRESWYFIAAPKVVRANQVVQLSVSIVKMAYTSVNVRAIIRRDNEELTSANEHFLEPGMRMLQMKLPENADYGNYTLRVQGSVNDGQGGYVFENETKLIFQEKQSSVFIQLNKPLYRQGQKVLFRVMPVESNLMSRSGSMNIYIEDSTGTTVRRWLSMQTNAGGVLDMAFQLTEQPHYGVWKIVVRAFGHTYSKDFEVNEFWVTAIDVNVSMPLYIMEDDFGLAGVISANLTQGHNRNRLSLGQPAKGTIQTRLELRLPPGEQEDGRVYVWPNITRTVKYFPGVTDFLFTTSDIRQLLQQSDAFPNPKTLAGKEVYVQSEVYDWFLEQSATGSAISVIYANEVDLVLLGDLSRTFKPNQTMNIYWALVMKDGMPINRVRRQVTVVGTEQEVGGRTTSFEHRLLVSDDGIVRFRHTPGPYGRFIRIQASYDTLAIRSKEMTATRHYSPTESFLTVTTSTETPKVDEYMVFTVTANTFIQRMYYLITAAGNIVTANFLDMYSRQKTFSLAVSRDMIPEAHIIVWHIFHGEVISDSLNFFVNGTRINTIDFRFNRGKDFTGDTVEVSTRTDPSSFVGTAGMDYELWAYGWGTFITETEIINELTTYDSHVNSSFKHTWKLPEEQTQMVHFPAPSFAIDANTTFEYAGLYVFTDANVTRMPHNCNETMGFWPCMFDGSCYATEQRCDGVRQCTDGQDEMGCEYPVVDKHTLPKHRLGLVTRHYVMVGEWLWGGHFVMPNGRIDLPVSVPDEPMAWVAGAFAISRELGFGLTHFPVRHQATRAFYMRAEAPEEVVKGEQIGIRVGLFNYWYQDLECIVMLHDSDDYKFVVVEEFGIVSSYAPRLLRGDIQTMVFLEKGAVIEIQIPVLPSIDGCITVKISASTNIYGDYEDIQICTKFDGVTNYLHTPYYIDLINSGSLVLPDLEIPVPERFIRPQERQHLYVPGSPVATVGIVGDVVGPGFMEKFLDAENTLRKPYGGAEQVAYNVAFNLYNLKYLRATNQMGKAEVGLQTEVLNNLNVALQRLLSYMNVTDSSFSMFRDYQEHTPSTWVTSFVLRVLQDANERDWELDFFIPSELLNKIGSWLCKQRAPSGSFVENSPLYDRKMWSNFTSSNGQMRRTNVSLTAHVVITLTQSDRLTGEAEICKNVAVQKAVDYLEKELDGITDVYELSIVTYALMLAGSPESTKAFQDLQTRRLESPYVYWANKPIPANDIRMIDTIPYYQPRRWYDNEGYAVEATSYALMSYLRRNLLRDSVPIMRWLQTMRNTFFAQASTQDSITALVALVEYAKLDTNRALYNIEVNVQATSMGNFSQRVRLNSDNWPIQQLVDVFPVWGSARGRAQGTGMALMQLETKVNVEYPHQIMPKAEGKWFDVELETMNMTGRNFSIFEATVCARWARPDVSEISGMAVLEMHKPTGYIVTNDVLRSYAQSGEVPTLRRAESYDRKIVFYFDYLNHTEKTCVKVRMDRWFPIANMTIQHKLRVFDYYEPGMHNTTLYNTWTLFNLHMCRVCGSFQCPYCRYYNLATTLNVSLAFSLAVSTFAFFLKRLISGNSISIQ